jgi:transcriptional regulator with GAF, ATPase, and Fis domain
LELKSVLAAPLTRAHQTVGALYLDNSGLSNAFDQGDLRFLESVSRFVTFYLHHARVLPALLKPHSRVFLDGSKAFDEIVGNDPQLTEVMETVRRIADSPDSVLIEGESGTGKELVARALHYQSKRADSPFVAINCAAIPNDLMESELFGHEKGAFTGATQRFPGYIQEADGGTLFLDELSELAHPLQAKLLRFLQSGEFRRLGGREVQRVDVRVVAATSKDLKALINSGEFQSGLYYRLCVIPVRLPALRERRDLALLAEHFLAKYSAASGKALCFEPQVLDALSAYPFPGNVRELENLIRRLVALAQDDSIRFEDLPREILQFNSERVSLAKDPLYRILTTPPQDLEDLKARKKEMDVFFAEQQRQLAAEVVEKAGSVTAAARELGVHRVTLHHIVKPKKTED